MDRYVKRGVDNTLLRRLQRTTPYYKESRICMYRKEECPRGIDCGRHGNPSKGLELLRKFREKKEYHYPREWQLTEPPPLGPPDDDSIRTIRVCGLDQRINEQDLRVNLFAHGEIESLKMVIERRFALVTYKTREGAAKAGEELPSKLCMKGLRLWLMWYAPKPGCVESDEAWQQAVAAQTELLPMLVKWQQKYHVPRPSPFQDQALELLPPQPREYYPSLDPQTTGPDISSPEGSSCGSNDS